MKLVFRKCEKISVLNRINYRETDPNWVVEGRWASGSVASRIDGGTRALELLAPDPAHSKQIRASSVFRICFKWLVTLSALGSRKLSLYLNLIWALIQYCSQWTKYSQFTFTLFQQWIFLSGWMHKFLIFQSLCFFG